MGSQNLFKSLTITRHLHYPKVCLNVVSTKCCFIRIQYQFDRKFLLRHWMYDTKITVFLLLNSCSVVDRYESFAGMYCSHLPSQTVSSCPDKCWCQFSDGGSRFLWNTGVSPPDYILLQAGSQLFAVAYRGGGLGCSNPPPKIAKALRNCTKLNPIVKTVKNCWI